MLVLENLNYVGGFHLWPTLYFYWIAVALRFNNSFSLVETVYWKEKKKPILSWIFTGVWAVFVSISFLSDHQFRRVCVPIRFSTQKALWRSYTGKSSRKSCFTVEVGRVIFQNCINVLIFRLSKINTVIIGFP